MRLWRLLPMPSSLMGMTTDPEFDGDCCCSVHRQAGPCTCLMQKQVWFRHQVG